MSRRYRRKRQHASSPFVDASSLAVILVFIIGWQAAQSSNTEVLIYLGIAVGVILIAIATIAILKYRYTQRKLRALQTADIDRMDWLRFEVYVAELLKNRGFTHVELTEKYDYGVDIIARKDDITWGVQVKRYSNLVKAEAVRQTVTALTHYKCNRAMVVTNSTFSRPAKVLALDNNCVLIDREILSTWIIEFQDKETKSRPISF